MSSIKPSKLNDMTNDDVKDHRPIDALLASLPTHCVIGQVGQSLDGRIATPIGHSHYINGLGARRFLHQLRASVDAVVIGVGTALADQPQLTVRHVKGEHPARVILDPRARLNADNPVLDHNGVPVIVFVGDAEPPPDWPSHIEVIGLPLSAEGFDPAKVISALKDHGLNRLLIEGGPTTLSAFIAHHQIDRLYCMIAPLIIGSGPSGIQLPAIDHLDEAIRVPMRRFDLDGEWLVEVRFDQAR